MKNDLMSTHAQAIIQQSGNDVLAILHKLNGYYECPKDPSGNRTGYLVGYAGKDEATGKQYVGEIYANFAVAEQYPEIMYFFAQKLAEKIPAEIKEKATMIVGPAMGGISIAMMLALVLGKKFAYIEKEVTVAKTASTREEADMKLVRHEISTDDFIIICEDVMNNFSTTAKTIELVETTGSTVIAVAGLLNRSKDIDDTFSFTYARKQRFMSVFPLVRKVIEQWKQEDGAVADDIAAGKLVTKPKNEWNKLMEAMAASREDTVTS